MPKSGNFSPAFLGSLTPAATSDEIMNFSCTDAKVDTTETVELSDFGDYKKAMFLKEKTGITKSIETSDSDELCIASNRKKTLLTETVETSDKDEMFS